ncbi:complement C3-like [Haliotis asinina]|uniref:complement C3-like n=1 Tax=Haliotis asinina TaxID=109174 RepID=UPI00353271A6
MCTSVNINMVRHFLSLGFLVWSLVAAEDTSPVYFIVAPNVIHVDTDEVVTVTTYGVQEEVTIRLSLLDFPKSTVVHYEQEVTVPSDDVVNATIRLPLSALPQTKLDPFYVSLVAECSSLALSFRQEVPVLVDDSPGVIFIQTDKPVYTPGQTVNVRVVPLNDAQLPSHWPVQIDIKNPDNVAVSRSVSEGNQSFVTDRLKIPDNPVYGNWTVEAKFYNMLKTSSKVRFEVKEYVLPTFTVKFDVTAQHRVILPDTEHFNTTLEATYVFGRPVKGHVTVTYGLVWHGHVFPMGKQRNILLNSTGMAEFHVKTDQVKLPVESVWFPNGGRLYLEADVTEEASGKVEHAIDQSVVFAETAYVFKFTRSSRFFKPGLPYILRVDVVRANGEPARGLTVVVEGEAAVREESIQLIPWNGGERRNFKTDDNGRLTLDFRLPSDAKNIHFMLKSKTKGLARASETVAHFGASPYFSPSDTYMLVKANPTAGDFENDIPAVGDYITIQTTNTDPVDLNIINLLVVSRGRVVLQLKTRNLGGARTQFHFPVTPEMSPSVRLLAFSMRGSEAGSEVIADSTWLDIEESCEHEITMNDDLSRRDHYRPGDTGTLTVKGMPHMEIGLLAVDKAVYYLKNKLSLSRSTVFDSLKQQDRGCGRGGGRDSANVFQDAGLTVLTNAGLRTEPRAQRACSTKYVRRRRGESRESAMATLCCNEGFAVENATISICYKFASVVKNGTKSEECASSYFRCCKHRVENPSNHTGSGRITKPEDVEDDGLDLPFDQNDVDVSSIPLRSNFPEAWWFEDYALDGDGKTEIEFTLPDTITTWVVQAIGVSRRHSFCVGKAHNIKAFKNFFIQLDLPFSAIRLEQLEVRATVYNYMDRNVTVKMYLSSEEGVCYSGDPGENSEVAELDVPANDASSVSFPIIPLEVGEYPVRVVAFSPWGYDAVERTLRVEGEGLEKIHTVSVMLDPTGKRLLRDTPYNSSFGLKSEINKHQSKQKVEVDLQLPKETIPKTEKCSVSAIGDLLGPTVTSVIKGLHNLLRLPTGCGEQNLIFLGPNVFVLRYLRAANRLPQAVEKKARTYIREGLNRQLTFRKPDGSYGTWPSADSSTWLTAFALKTFTQAAEFVTVDPVVTCQAFEWLLHKQKEDGTFIENAGVMHKEMTGGVNGDATLTAFVLIALLESECIPMSRNFSERIRRRAVEFLEQELVALDRPLAVAMTAYALTMSLSPERHNAFEKMKAMGQSSVDGHTFWPAGEIDHIEGHFHEPLWYAKRPGALAVETTAYALLTYLEHGFIKESHSIVSWLMGQRESHGSFVSTQDTVIGLQALSEYSIKTYSSILDMTCDLRSDVDASFKESILLQHEDAFVLKTVPRVPTGGKLVFEAAGTGVGMMQVEVRYNVPDEDNSCRFDVIVKSTRLSHMLSQFFWQRGNSECEPCSQECDEEETGEDEEEEDDDIESFTFPSVVPRIQDPRRKLINHYVDHQGSRIGRPFSRIGKPLSRRARSLVASARVLCIEVCVRYHGNRETGMSVVDVGLFTGYKPVESDLKNLIDKGKIQHYEQSQRSVIFYMEEISHKKNECLKFRAKQSHMAENIQPAKVQVYDYYNPDERCTKFYKPDNASGQLANFCDKQRKICQCLEGRCGQCEEVWYGKKWTSYVHYSCQNATNILLVKILDHDVAKAGFERYLGVVQQDVYQVGPRRVEPRTKVILLKRASCSCPGLEKDKVYVMMLREPKKFVDVEGNEVHAFLLDQKAFVVEYYRLRDKGLKSQQKQLARHLKRTVRRLSRKGCRKLTKRKKGKGKTRALRTRARSAKRRNRKHRSMS